MLLVAALLVMAATLALVFRARLRLLPLAIALAAAALTFGALSLAGRVADDGVDRGAAGADRPRGRLRDPVAVARARRPGATSSRRRALGAPTIVTAAAATTAGFLVLLLSPVPMVRGFGLLLVVGIVIALALALVAGTAALALAARAGRPGAARRSPRRCAAPATCSAAGRPRALAGDRAAARAGGAPRAAPPARGALGAARSAAPAACWRSPPRSRVAGWGLDTQTRVESDITKLVPQDLAGAARTSRRCSSRPASAASSTSWSRPTTSPTRRSSPG